MAPDDELGGILWLLARFGELRRREQNRMREGVIAEARPAEGLYRVRFRDEEGDEPAFVGPWMRVEALSSGALKIQGEPVVGQPVQVRSESGDLADGIITLSSFSADQQRPHDKNGELKITVGGYSLLLDAAGAETTKALARLHETDGDVTFRTGGIVSFE